MRHQQDFREQRRTKAERRAIVEETLVPGAAVSRVARRHDVNANQVFHWRKLYQEGRLGTTGNFLPVRVAIDLRPSVEEIRYVHGGSLCSWSMGSMDALLR